MRGLVFIAPAGFEDVKESVIEGDVTFGNYTGIGANSVVMPDNTVPEGVAVGALSFVPARFTFEPWTVYAGAPIRRIGPRDREAVLRQLRRFEERTRGTGSGMM